MFKNDRWRKMQKKKNKQTKNERKKTKKELELNESLDSICDIACIFITIFASSWEKINIQDKLIEKIKYFSFL